MIDKEKEAIEILKDDEMYITDSFYREFRTTIADKYTKAFETVLNLVEKQDKMINLMAEQLRTPVNSKEWIKEYYKHEVKTKIYTEEEMDRIEKEDMGYDR